jgi:hypothetical protein
VSVSYSNGDAGLYAALFLIVSLAITWLIMYTAVRAATGHALDRMKPRFVAEAITTPQGVQFEITNVGSAPAVDLTVRWTDRPLGEPLAQALLLAVNARLEWILAVPQVEGEISAVRSLRLDWSRGPELGRAAIACVVLVPSRLNAAG